MIIGSNLLKFAKVYYFISIVFYISFLAIKLFNGNRYGSMLLNLIYFKFLTKRALLLPQLLYICLSAIITIN